MRADNTAGIILAAQRRHELTRAKAVRALRQLDHAGAPVTFEAVARTAGVSRSWLYGQPDLRTEIERLREATRQPSVPSIPARQQASDASLLTRLQAALDKNRKPTEENQRLRRQLAQALGDERVSGRDRQTKTTPMPAPRCNSVTIGPCQPLAEHPTRPRRRHCPRRICPGHSTAQRQSSR